VKSKDYGIEFNVSKICMINSEMVKYFSLRETPGYKDDRMCVPVLSGNWDLLQRRIEDSYEYEVVKRELGQSVNVNRNGEEIARAKWQTRLLHTAENGSARQLVT
jgi:hypothetical protein